MTACAQCGFENADGRKFCGGCGVPLALTCPTCGAANEAGARFCGECGSPLTADTSAPAPVAAAERRHVSVLFADLVGFTPLSESRDPEEVRELLSRYFDRCRRLIEIYGGTVEKFIGDAVMAVWGTPVAQEDDAERAVRTALDLVAGVAALADEVGAPELQARAGVLTGEAAVSLLVAGEGMVAGDLVNTAARIQAAAAPGTVLVGEATRRATAAAIAYEPAGEHELKGKAEPVSLFRALRVTSVRGGALRSGELEPPFVGRARELRLVKELFHATAEERKAHLVSVVGVAGIGKSRLAWEFEKYLDGPVDVVLWHRGRCLAYGDGVAYWALAEMVRMRALIAEEDTAESALEKLRTMLRDNIADADERSWLEPRLAHLLGLAEHAAGDRQDLFAAWRLFFERLAEENAVALVFEDLQWADSALLDFIEFLLEWSRAHPIFVLALARPELGERRPGFGSAGRNATTLSLEPLAPAAMEELLEGFVPGLPDELRARILDRAEGVPLYAVETVRMLLDRGLLAREDDVYRPSGPIETLDVPETLHALVAARLDGLEAEERRVLQDAAVLGKSFTKAGLSALSDLSESELEPLLASLVRKQVLSVEADPRSPERGHYAFLQDLLKQIAYETLAKAGRKAKHLAAAAHLERASTGAEQELIEVVAAHFVDAYEAAPDAPDAAEIRHKAAERLALAGDRASSLGANEAAERYFEKAAALAEDPRRQADLIERAGGSARWPLPGGNRIVRRCHRALPRIGRAEAGRARDRQPRLRHVEYGRPRRRGRPLGGGIRSPCRRRARARARRTRGGFGTPQVLPRRERGGPGSDRAGSRDRGGPGPSRRPRPRPQYKASSARGRGPPRGGNGAPASRDRAGPRARLGRAVEPGPPQSFPYPQLPRPVGRGNRGAARDARPGPSPGDSVAGAAHTRALRLQPLDARRARRVGSCPVHGLGPARAQRPVECESPRGTLARRRRGSSRGARRVCGSRRFRRDPDAARLSRQRGGGVASRGSSARGARGGGKGTRRLPRAHAPVLQAVLGRGVLRGARLGRPRGSGETAGNLRGAHPVLADTADRGAGSPVPRPPTRTPWG